MNQKYLDIPEKRGRKEEKKGHPNFIAQQWEKNVVHIYVEVYASLF